MPIVVHLGSEVGEVVQHTSTYCRSDFAQNVKYQGVGKRVAMVVNTQSMENKSKCNYLATPGIVIRGIEAQET